MKKAIFTWAVLAMLVLTVGCTQKPEELIIGKWQFDRLSVKEGTTYTAEDSSNMNQKSEIIKGNGLVFSFQQDLTCSIGSTENQQSGTYTLKDGKLLTILLAEDVPQDADIINISKEELTLLFDDPQLKTELVHFKKVE